MDSKKYIGMDVHQATISVAVMDAAGKLVMESIIETKASTILEFLQGLRGSLVVTFEEGTCAAWLYALLKQHVTKLVVCDPRQNALLKTGNKNDRIDARKLAELLRAGLLCPVYHGESGIAVLKELSRSYLTVSKDLTRVMNRLKALYRSWGIPSPVKKFTRRVIAASGWNNYRKPACAFGPSCSIDNSMLCNRCGSKPGGNCWLRAGNTWRVDFFSRFPAWAPFELRCSSP